MKWPTQIIVLCIALTTILSTATAAQDAYANCSTNYTVLENALLETSDNLFQMSTVFFNPDYANPLYVDVYYNFSGSCTQAHYKWSTASLYLIVAPPALGYLSLFFSYFDETRMGTLTLQLPYHCKELVNVTASTRVNFLYVLTQRIQIYCYMALALLILLQLRVYAKYYHSLDNMLLPDGFEARVVSINKQRVDFIDNVGVKLFFTFVFTFPIIALSFCWCSIKGTRLHIRKILNKPGHHSSLAALVCVGQTFTLYVAIMDTIALYKDGIVDYMRGFIISIVTIEYIAFVLITVLVFILSCNQCLKRDELLIYSFNCVCWPIFCGLKLNTNEVKSWFVAVGFIPPLICLSSHIGFIIEAWVSFENHGTALMLFYPLAFIALYVIFQNIYLVAVDYKGIYTIKSIVSRHPMSKQGYKNLELQNEYILHQDEEEIQEDEKQKSGLNFCILFWEMLIGIPLLSSVLVYIAFGFCYLPTLRSTEDVVPHFYNFGHISIIFVVFLFTYNLMIFQKKETLSGLVSKDTIKFWKFLESGRKKTVPNPTPEHIQESIRDLNIESNTDKANALNAVLLYRLMQLEQGDIDHCEHLLSEIVPEGKSESKDPDSTEDNRLSQPLVYGVSSYSI